MQGAIILGNQLFPEFHFKSLKRMPVFMAEDTELCTYYRFHKHKIVMFLSAMRHFALEMEKQGYELTYHEISERADIPYMEKLKEFIQQNKIRELHTYEIEDKFMEQRIVECCQTLAIDLRVHPSPMFTCTREQFSIYLQEKKKPFMKTFYERQRRQLDILMENGKPYGGRFSFDADNRKKMPKNHLPPTPLPYIPDNIDNKVIDITNKLFPKHPGNTADYWLATTRSEVLRQFRDFLEKRMAEFGPYQDAITQDTSFLHHSLISPAMNVGLITPTEVVAETVDAFQKKDLAIQSIEGFIRQIIGWREFVRGIYQNYSEHMETSNYWNSHRQFKDCWYTGETGLPPLDDTIRKAVKTGYSHHIERLMILANLMNLCEIHPHLVHRWFMEMYVDSSDWVMAANVYGMGLMSDGGLFATKPYISGSNYILKMSNYKKGPWCDIWDGLYWRFVEKHYDFFARNPRMRMMTRTLDAMKPQRKNLIFTEAEAFLDRVTYQGCVHSAEQAAVPFR